MKVSGFTIIQNAVRFDFPIVEAITSVLPLVDEFVVNVGKSDDGTLALVRSIDSRKVHIVETEWDETLRQDGAVFGMQQNAALSHCTGDWSIMVQGDEVLHEDDYPEIRHAMARWLPRREVLGLVLRMMHFKGDYWSLDPWMYRRATRIVRNHCGVHCPNDGCDFAPAGTSRMIKAGPYGRRIKARVFHYGWVKPPDALKGKLSYQISRHEGDRLSPQDIASRAALAAAYPMYDILKEYRGAHPAVMRARIAAAGRLRRRHSRWLNPRFYKEALVHGFKG